MSTLDKIDQNIQQQLNQDNLSLNQKRHFEKKSEFDQYDSESTENINKKQKLNNSQNGEKQTKNISQKQQTNNNSKSIQPPKDKNGNVFQNQLCSFIQKSKCQLGPKCNLKHMKESTNLIPSEEFEYDLDEIRNHNYIDKQEVKNLEYQLEPQEPKINENDELILIRHGVSLYNYIANKFTYQTGLSFKSDEALFYQLDHELVDSPLHYYGKVQCQNTQKFSNKLNIHTIFVSPQQRALETCYNIFKNHPEFVSKKMKIIVLPQLTEILSKIQDVAANSMDDNIRGKFEKYGFDFSHIKYPREFSPNEWQIFNIQDECLRDQLKQKLRLQKNKKEGWKNVCLDQIEANFPKSIETYEMVFRRKNQARNFIKQYTQRYNIDLKKQKICIVSHHGFLKTYTSKGISHTGYVKEGYSFGNCQLVSYRL